jgi:hypothetical protein
MIHFFFHGLPPPLLTQGTSKVSIYLFRIVPSSSLPRRREFLLISARAASVLALLLPMWDVWMAVKFAASTVCFGT